ncbi:hypothetical protein BpHYR1_008554 [Brachionus plicatilis]|uniref:Uncharacterized protein n=1 Tax=Brachionus plicatilis TaxID=10195 RepID=A0A3M7PDL1_BRAPC|nr:hypothetical protein BpHYR1_008554 [Brachionus plicatilis]
MQGRNYTMIQNPLCIHPSVLQPVEQNDLDLPLHIFDSFQKIDARTLKLKLIGGLMMHHMIVNSDMGKCIFIKLKIKKCLLLMH